MIIAGSHTLAIIVDLTTSTSSILARPTSPADTGALPAIALSVAVALRNPRQQCLQLCLDARSTPRQQPLPRELRAGGPPPPAGREARLWLRLRRWGLI